jgi:hypothetical protein
MGSVNNLVLVVDSSGPYLFAMPEEGPSPNLLPHILAQKYMSFWFGLINVLTQSVLNGSEGSFILEL